MKKYRNFQFGWIIVLIFIVAITIIVLGYKYQWGNSPIDLAGLVFFSFFFGVLILLFYGITIKVTDEHLIIRFGIGLIDKRIKLSSIKSIDTVKNSPYCGYGIRIISNGILYNVSGRQAIEIRLKGKKNVVQIGTNDWENLKIAIEERLKINGYQHSV
jgi:hypothetical protein